MITATNEKPILFSGPMVRAILEGRKTQTRRIIKPQPLATKVNGGVCYSWAGERREDGRIRRIPNGPRQCHGGAKVSLIDLIGEYCPYGKVGDQLWVRETFAKTGYGAHSKGCYRYRATDATNAIQWRGKWTPSIYMPRIASRLTLEITGIRAERLQSISEEDAIAEGSQCAGVPASLTNRGAFAKLWNQINGEESWALNPWVWVIEFRKQEH